ncbi:MAG: hypothetical protein Q8J99_19845 [Sulfuritalea sp.]|nr:hypothetical protein [Sulfuritalea sp.]
MVGLPAASAPAEIAGASERQFQALFEKASRGDAAAQRELVRLRLAYLNWAYAGQRLRRNSASTALP